MNLCELTDSVDFLLENSERSLHGVHITRYNVHAQQLQERVKATRQLKRVKQKRRVMLYKITFVD